MISFCPMLQRFGSYGILIIHEAILRAINLIRKGLSALSIIIFEGRLVLIAIGILKLASNMDPFFLTCIGA